MDFFSKEFGAQSAIGNEFGKLVVMSLRTAVGVNRRSGRVNIDSGMVIARRDG